MLGRNVLFSKHTDTILHLAAARRAPASAAPTPLRQRRCAAASRRTRSAARRAALPMGWASAAAGACVIAAGSAAFMMSRHLTEPAPRGVEGRRAKLEAFADDIRDKLFKGVPEVTAEELAAMLSSDDKVVVIDVRTPGEQEVSMIPGPKGAVVTRVEYERDPYKWKGYQAVCQCTVGYRSAEYAQKLGASPDAGLASAANLRGGILAYTYSGLPLVDPATGAETRRVHVYAPRWAWQNDGYEAVAFKAPLLSMVKETISNALGLRK